MPKNVVKSYGTGKRKTSIARVFLSSGNGDVTVNGRLLDTYFCRETLQMLIRQPLVVAESIDRIDVVATVVGGGASGQAGAIRHGIARALLARDESLRPALRKAGLLTRDSRIVERKKVGLRGARRGTQFSKR